MENVTTSRAIERRRKLLGMDLEARCVIGGPGIEAELLSLVDAHLADQERIREIEALCRIFTDPIIDLMLREGPPRPHWWPKGGRDRPKG